MRPSKGGDEDGHRHRLRRLEVKRDSRDSDDRCARGGTVMGSDTCRAWTATIEISMIVTVLEYRHQEKCREKEKSEDALSARYHYLRAADTQSVTSCQVDFITSSVIGAACSTRVRALSGARRKILRGSLSPQVLRHRANT